MKFAVALLCISCLIQLSVSFLNDNTCTSDSDCHNGCCLQTKEGSKCEIMGTVGSVCDVDGKADDVCPCVAGLKCNKIDLSDFGPTAAAVNPIFEKFHYGLCEMEPQSIG